MKNLCVNSCLWELYIANDGASNKAIFYCHLVRVFGRRVELMQIIRFGQNTFQLDLSFLEILEILILQLCETFAIGHIL